MTPPGAGNGQNTETETLNKIAENSYKLKFKIYVVLHRGLKLN
jgi:hypothetical protein